jgi:hypothetical protein
VAGSGLVALDMAPYVQRAFVLPFVAALAVMVAAWFTANRPLRTTLDEAEDHEAADLTRRAVALNHP